MMVSEEQYLWFCRFRFHGQEHMWWGYFRDAWAVEAFIARVRELLPCLSISVLRELKEGLPILNDYFYYRLSSQLAANEELRRSHVRLTHLGQPSPITRDHLASFVFDLSKTQPCPFCAQSWPAIEALVAGARRKGRARVG